MWELSVQGENCCKSKHSDYAERADDDDHVEEEEEDVLGSRRKATSEQCSFHAFIHSIIC
jgi:hypothetical protein